MPWQCWKGTAGCCMRFSPIPSSRSICTRICWKHAPTLTACPKRYWSTICSQPSLNGLAPSSVSTRPFLIFWASFPLPRGPVLSGCRRKRARWKTLSSIYGKISGPCGSLLILPMYSSRIRSLRYLQQVACEICGRWHDIGFQGVDYFSDSGITWIDAHLL